MFGINYISACDPPDSQTCIDENSEQILLNSNNPDELLNAYNQGSAELKNRPDIIEKMINNIDNPTFENQLLNSIGTSDGPSIDQMNTIFSNSENRNSENGKRIFTQYLQQNLNVKITNIQGEVLNFDGNTITGNNLEIPLDFDSEFGIDSEGNIYLVSNEANSLSISEGVKINKNGDIFEVRIQKGSSIERFTSTRDLTFPENIIFIVEPGATAEFGDNFVYSQNEPVTVHLLSKESTILKQILSESPQKNNVVQIGNQLHCSGHGFLCGQNGDYLATMIAFKKDEFGYGSITKIDKTPEIKLAGNAHLLTTTLNENYLENAIEIAKTENGKFYKFPNNEFDKKFRGIGKFEANILPFLNGEFQNTENIAFGSDPPSLNIQFKLGELFKGNNEIGVTINREVQKGSEEIAKNNLFGTYLGSSNVNIDGVIKWNSNEQGGTTINVETQSSTSEELVIPVGDNFNLRIPSQTYTSDTTIETKENTEVANIHTHLSGKDGKPLYIEEQDNGITSIPVIGPIIKFFFPNVEKQAVIEDLDVKGTVDLNNPSKTIDLNFETSEGNGVNAEVAFRVFGGLSKTLSETLPDIPAFSSLVTGNLAIGTKIKKIKTNEKGEYCLFFVESTYDQCLKSENS